jgi:hypothetical protein
MSHPEIGRAAEGAGEPFSVDVDKLVGTHLALIANSGAGKSRSLRKLLEATHGRLQHIVIDDEEEFYTLRERFDYVIAGGENGDCPATPDNAEALALALLENGLSAIVQTGSLDVDQGQAFVSRFLNALIKAPKRLWHPVLVVIDEAQRFAPNDGRVASSDAAKEFAASARKRGYTMVVATGRFSAIDTNVRSHCVNWLIGRAGLTVDRKAAANELGFPPSSPEARGLKNLLEGQFWAFGPALAREPTLFRFGEVLTTHLQRGQARVPTPPAGKELQVILAGLAATATPAAGESTAAPSDARAAQPAPDPAAIEAAEKRGFSRGESAGFERGLETGGNIARAFTIATLKEAREALDRAIAEQAALQGQQRPDLETSVAATAALLAPAATPARKTRDASAKELTAEPSEGERKILATLIDGPRSWAAVAIRAGYAMSGGGFRRAKKASIARGLLIEADGRVRLSEPAPSGTYQGFNEDVLTGIWSARLADGAGRLLVEIVRAGGQMTIGELAGATGYAASGGGFRRAVKALVSSGLAEKDGDGAVRLTSAWREAAGEGSP